MFGHSDFRRAVQAAATSHTDGFETWTEAVGAVHRYAFFPLESVPHCQLAPTNIMPDPSIPDGVATIDEESFPPHRIRPRMEYGCALLAHLYPPLPPNA